MRIDQDYERVSKALELLMDGMYPFVERKMKAAYKEKWHDSARASFRKNRGQGLDSNGRGEVIHWDAHTLLTVMWDQWNQVFRHCLGPAERSLVSELREYRNRWAHQTKFNFDDTYRILDSVERLLRATQENDNAVKQLSSEKRNLLRRQFSDEAKVAYKKSKIVKQKWLDTGVYIVCGASIVTVIFQVFPLNESWLIVTMVVMLFGYFSYQRIVSQPPLFYGPHECAGCRRIIYGETCPYCEKPSQENDPDSDSAVPVSEELSEVEV
ncbi:MAG: hypothetical protein IID46_06165 [Planctomycetes bacterium]|nr:hypothetical protein [Planctomycetota bacterium]